MTRHQSPARLAPVHWIQTCVCLLLSFLDASNGGYQGHHGHGTHNEIASPDNPASHLNTLVPSRWGEPYFDTSLPQNVTALAGKSAYLSCRVINLGNKTVSFVRHRDLHILTVATYTYTSDQRFTATYHRDANEWTLQIKFAQKRDAGAYECQISTQPVKSFSIDLSIVVPTATILGGPDDLYVDKGSSINLTCLIRFSPEPPAYIFWYHQNDVVSTDSREGIKIHTEHHNDAAISYLLIRRADFTDSGKYTCSPSNAELVSIRVNVLNGERPEAMQTGSSNLTNKTNRLFTIIFISYMFEYLVPLVNYIYAHEVAAEDVLGALLNVQR